METGLIQNPTLVSGMTWLKKISNVLLDNLVESIVAALVVAASPFVIYYAKDWLLVPVPTRPVLPVGLGALSVVLCLFILRTWLRTRQKAKPFRVHEQSMNVFWWIQTPPEKWIDRSLDSHDDLFVDGLLSGPYCATKRDDGDFCHGSFASRKHGHIRARCDSCGRDVIESLLGAKSSTDDVPLPDLKRATVRVLQREVRRGVRLRKGMTFRTLDFGRREIPVASRYV